MAIIKFGIAVTGIRGTIGGTVFSANATGPYAKLWSEGPQPRTNLQQTQRSILGSMGAYWLALSSAQRADWDTYAGLLAQRKTNALGEFYYCTGWNWFVANVRQQRMVTSTPTYTAPVGARPGAPTISTVNIYTTGGGSSNITYPVDEFLGAFIILKMRLWSSQAVISGNHGTQMIFTAGPDSPTQTWFQQEIIWKYGTPIIGQRACVTVCRQNTDGQRSTETVNYANVTL